MKFISLFAGVGGFDLALSRLGHECVYANDIDKYCKIIYDKNFSNQCEVQAEQADVRNLPIANINDVEKPLSYYDYQRSGLDNRSITNVSTEEIPDHELLVGGFPCQSFSIAGKRRGFDDTRGTLFFEIARILTAKEPQFFILENVKGLLSHDNGRTFKVIISTLDELGYDLQWQLLNSKNFGVPQNRERVFIIGHLRGTGRPKIFPITGESRTNNEYKPNISSALDANYYKGPSRGYGGRARQLIRKINKPIHSNNRVYGIDGVSPTLNTMQGGNRQPEIVMKLHKGQSGTINDPSSISRTMPSEAHGHAVIMTVQYSKIRRLTPTECERLQGFPDGWTEGVSDTQRYKMMGNAVTVNVVYEIGKRL